MMSSRCSLSSGCGFCRYFQKRYDKALHYFEMLSNRGDWQATFQLGVMYYDGLGVEQNTVSLFFI